LCQARRFECARAAVRRELSALRAGVARIEKAAARGDFANSVFFTTRMGRTRLVYPDPAVRRLIRRSLRTLAGASGGSRAPHRNIEQANENFLGIGPMPV
jgi:hypothetical protein